MAKPPSPSEPNTFTLTSPKHVHLFERRLVAGISTEGFPAGCV
jgi:hypothetical protein